MKTIILEKNKPNQIGNVRVSSETYQKIQNIARSHNVTKQTVVRAIIENYIDNVSFS